ncbi:unnamed protein product, partial [Phaeothamnion confervicola]
FLLSTIFLSCSCFVLQRSSGGGGGAGARFSAPRSYAAPRTSINVYPSIGSPFGYSPFGFSPFGFGGGFGGGFGLGVPIGPSIGVYRGGWGVNPLDLLVFGGALYAASTLLRGVERGGFGAALDGDSDSALGSGTSVVKLQVALNIPDRGSGDSVLEQLRDLAGRADSSSGRGLSTAVSEAALALVRRQNDWLSAASDFDHFGRGSSDGAERAFNRFAITERSKVERETLAKVGGRDVSARRGGGALAEAGRPTLAVVTLVVALRGDSMKRLQLEKSLNSAPALRKALTQLAADAMADDGDGVVAAELLWTPEEPWETLDRRDVVQDFPELMDL